MPPKPAVDDRPFIDYSVIQLIQEIDNAARQLSDRHVFIGHRRVFYDIRRQLYRELWHRRQKARK